MPRKRKRKRKYKKKKGGWRKTKGMSSSLIRSPRMPLPTTLKTNMLYSTMFFLNPGVGSVAIHNMRANSLFDPDATGVGHQPRGFDDLMALYDHFVVVGVSIRVTFSNSDLTDPLYVGIALTADGAALDQGRLDDYMEYGRTQFAVLNVHDTAGSVKTVSMNSNPNKFLGRSKPLADPELKGSAFANPTEEAIFQVWCASMNDAYDSVGCVCRLEMEFISILIEPKQPDMS